MNKILFSGFFIGLIFIFCFCDSGNSQRRGGFVGYVGTSRVYKFKNDEGKNCYVVETPNGSWGRGNDVDIDCSKEVK